MKAYQQFQIDSFLRFKKWTNRTLFDPKTLTENDSKEHCLTDLITTETRLFCLGSAGAGKSTILRYVCFSYADRFLAREDNVPVPILVALRQYGERNLLELTYGQLQNHGVPDFDITCFSSQVSRNWIILLDGFDEIQRRYREQFLVDLNHLQSSLKDSIFVLTARKQPAVSSLDNFKAYELQPLDNKGIRLLAQVYLPSKSDSFLQQVGELDIWDIFRVPLLLTLCLILFRN